MLLVGKVLLSLIDKTSLIKAKQILCFRVKSHYFSNRIGISSLPDDPMCSDQPYYCAKKGIIIVLFAIMTQIITNPQKRTFGLQGSELTLLKDYLIN